ncbi:unnamed protein product [Lampetra fluviatilis]
MLLLLIVIIKPGLFVVIKSISSSSFSFPVLPVTTVGIAGDFLFPPLQAEPGSDITLWEAHALLARERREAAPGREQAACPRLTDSLGDSEGERRAHTHTRGGGLDRGGSADEE